jgi:GINS complex subunit 2
MSKLRSSVIGFVKNAGTYAKLDHLTAMEINSIRSLLPDALDIMLHMEQAGKSSTLQSLNTTL